MVQLDNPVASRMADIQPFHVMELLTRARALEAQGRSIIHMEIGEPDFLCPQPIIDAGVQAVQSGAIQYTPAAGLPQLRAAISQYYWDRYQAKVAPERIVITPGSSGALLLAMGVLVNPGEEVLITDPGYPCNRNFVLFAGGVPKPVAVGSASGYQLTPQMLSDNWSEKTAAALIASPSNPTGTIVPPDSLRVMVDLAAQRGGRLIMDEIYHGLTYEGNVPSALNITDDVFVIGSFSKYWGMTGWRIGWLVAPERFVRDVEKLAQNLFISASGPGQYAAVAAFDPRTLEIVEQRRREFQERRDFLLPALRDLGFDIPAAPTGAFYLYAGCSRFTADSYRFCWDLLEKAGVAITPGIDFGSHLSEQHVRFSYTNSLDNLKEGVRRIQNFVTGAASGTKF